MDAPTPSLEHLKKQAKLLLKQHRDQYFPVCQRIRLASPRFFQMTDRGILGASFALHDAHQVIAREHGFDSWAMLKQHVPAMTKKSNPTKTTEKPSLIEAYPMLYVTDVTKAAEYYKNTLGFKIDYLYGKPPFYGMVSRDKAGLHLRHVDKHPLNRTEPDLLAVSIPVQEIKSLFLEFKAAGAKFHQSLKRQPWGATDFILEDLDGNLLNFAASR
jgi:uncharacterized glyoxalase superfamily protein PhnB